MISADAQAFLGDVTKLRESMLPFAKKMLMEHGEFFPFARVIDGTGSLVALAAAPGNSGAPGSKIYDRLIQAVSASAKERRFRAIGICSNVMNDAGASAIRLLLESCDGSAFEVVVPYKATEHGRYEMSPEVYNQVRAIIF